MIVAGTRLFDPLNESIRDIRDVISIGKLVRKNDGPEEVGQILRYNDQVWRNERGLNEMLAKLNYWVTFPW